MRRTFPRAKLRRRDDPVLRSRQSDHDGSNRAAGRIISTWSELFDPHILNLTSRTPRVPAPNRQRQKSTQSWHKRSRANRPATHADLSTLEGTMSATRSRSNPGGIQDVLQVLGPDVEPYRGRKPPWFKVPAPGGPRYRELQSLIKAENLHTVCQEAACPNIGECWQRGTATFMILGDTCTRRCGFCNVKTGKPTWNDPLEPARVARSVARMGLRHAVITSVDRDDMHDYGAHAFVAVIRQIRRQSPTTKVEVLTPDFRGQEMPIASVIDARPDVFNHNVEVVPRLYPVARRGSTWQRSTRVLRTAKEMGGDAGHDEVGADGRPRRVFRGDGRRARDIAREPRAGRDDRPVPAPDREPSADRPLLASGRIRAAGAGGLRARVRARRGRAAGPLELPRRPARRPDRARRRAAEGGRELTRMRRRLLTAAVAAVALVTLLALAPAALAAAGSGSAGFSDGGGGFSGGGGGFAGHGGGAGRGFALFFLFRALFDIARLGHGLGLLVLLALALLWYLWRRGLPSMERFWQARSRAGHAHRRQTRERERRVELAAAEAADEDPVFGPEHVRAAAGALFTEIQFAWDSEDRLALRRHDRAASCWASGSDDSTRCRLSGWHNRVAARQRAER